MRELLVVNREGLRPSSSRGVARRRGFPPRTVGRFAGLQTSRHDESPGGGQTAVTPIHRGIQSYRVAENPAARRGFLQT
jgi:hypothetical protein